MSEASAGVAMPPAQNSTTGRPPSWATPRTRSSGACRSFAAVASSASSSVPRRRISDRIERMWRTASTMSPVPASPLERIIAAPSPMRRSASPRFVAPHTNGTENAHLSMWLSLVGRRQDLGLVDVVDLERLEHLRLGDVADARLRHDGDRHGVLDRLDHRRVGHPRDAAVAADVGGHALERHDGGRAGGLGDPRLLGVDDVHDDAALEHLGQAGLHAECRFVSHPRRFYRRSADVLARHVCPSDSVRSHEDLPRRRGRARRLRDARHGGRRGSAEPLRRVPPAEVPSPAAAAASAAPGPGRRDAHADTRERRAPRGLEQAAAVPRRRDRRRQRRRPVRRAAPRGGRVWRRAARSSRSSRRSRRTGRSSSISSRTSRSTSRRSCARASSRPARARSGASSCGRSRTSASPRVSAERGRFVLTSVAPARIRLATGNVRPRTGKARFGYLYLISKNRRLRDADRLRAPAHPGLHDGLQALGDRLLPHHARDRARASQLPRLRAHVDVPRGAGRRGLGGLRQAADRAGAGASYLSLNALMRSA